MLIWTVQGFRHSGVEGPSVLLYLQKPHAHHGGSALLRQGASSAQHFQPNAHQRALVHPGKLKEAGVQGWKSIFSIQS